MLLRCLVHRLRQRDHDELGGAHGSHPDVADQHAAIDLFGRVRLSIAFYVKRLLGIPSYEHPALVEIRKKSIGSARHEIPGALGVGLEGDPREPSIERPT